MNKKTLGIILVVLIVVVVGVVYFGYQKGLFGGIGIKGIGKKSIMDAAREQGQIVPSKAEAIKECEKETDQDEKNTCYGLMAFYYRDAILCQKVKDSEMKKNCNRENIEKWYSEIEKGGAVSPFMPGLLMPGGGMLPGGGIIPGGEPSQPDAIPNDVTNEDREKPTLSGRMTDEIYVEILARTSYYAQKYAQDPKSFASHMKDLYKKYDITEEDITAYAQELEKNPQRAGEVGLKYIQRAQELQATGE